MRGNAFGRGQPVAAVQTPNRKPVPKSLGRCQDGGIGPVFGIRRCVTILTPVCGKMIATGCVTRGSAFLAGGRPFS